MKQKAGRNKTIDIPLEQGGEYLSRCITLRERAGIERVRDSVILGDTFEQLSLLPERCASLVIADPPYNMDKSFNSSGFSRMSGAEYEAYTRRWLELVIPRMTKNGSIYVCCDWQTSMIIGPIMAEYFTLRSRITWQREKGRGAAKNWKNGMEDIWFATLSGDYYFDLDAVRLRRRVLAPYRENGRPKDWVDSADGQYRDTCPSNFWDDITVPFWSMPENTAHPTQKPEKLCAKLILASSAPGDTVLDPFLGSGTTAVTAKKLGRHYIGIERDEQYCVFAQKRLELAETDAGIQGYSGGVFWERHSGK